MDLEAGEGEETVDFTLDEEGAAGAGEAQFVIEEEAEEEGEFAIEAETEEQDEAISISDLAPEEEPVVEEEQELAEEVVVEAEPAVAEEEVSTGGEAKELEDLEVEGIDLASTAAPKSGKVMPSVKTGTALDDFDIDLGDLITKKKENN